MYCTDCGSRNPKDSKFCRECGRKMVSLEDETRFSPNRPSKALKIETAEPTQEPEKLSQLLDMAFWHNEVGNVNGAVMACEAALKVDPYSTSALSLLGCLYEKLGNDEKAIKAFERVVELNPESIADAEKLEHLMSGIRSKAITPSLVHQLTPPALLQATRKYPKLPMVTAAVIGLIFLTAGIETVWTKFQTVPSPQSEPISSVSSLIQTPRSTAVPAAQHPLSAPVQTIQQTPGLPTPSSGVSPDPFITQRENALEMSAASQSDLDNVVQEHHGERQSRPDNSAVSMPSVSYIKPLTVPSSMVPSHIVSVAPPPSNDHIVMVSPPSQDNQSSQSNGTPDTDLPPPPPSHIFITVHGASSPNESSGATPLPSDSTPHAISLRENAGASLQQKGLNLQEQGNYGAAEAAYESAIAAYQEDLEAGRNADEAKRGIDACKVAVEICKQSS